MNKLLSFSHHSFEFFQLVLPESMSEITIVMSLWCSGLRTLFINFYRPSFTFIHRSWWILLIKLWMWGVIAIIRYDGCMELNEGQWKLIKSAHMHERHKIKTVAIFDIDSGIPSCYCIHWNKVNQNCDPNLFFDTTLTRSFVTMNQIYYFVVDKITEKTSGGGIGTCETVSL